MSKKLSIIATITLIAAVSFFYTKKTTENKKPLLSENKEKIQPKASKNEETMTKNTPLKKEYKFVSKNLKETKLWKDFANPYIDNQKLISQYDSDEIITFSKKAIKEVKTCLSDFCGQKVENSRGYFDPENTDGHQIIERSLSLLTMVNNDNNQVRDDKLFESLFEIKNDTIQALAFELYSSSGMNADKFQKSIEYIQKFNDLAKAQSLVLLENSSTNDRLLREDYIQALSQSLKANDSSSVQVVKKLDYLELSRDELSQIIESVCDLRQPSSTKQNWLAMKYHIEKYSEGKSYQLDIDSKCK